METDSSSTTGALARGASIGRYVVLGLIGKGGMGEVYAAYDPELDRKVAVKLLLSRAAAGVDSVEARGRMLREAQALAQLRDPNVVVVYDVGTFGERVFLAMEFVDGNTLSYWLHAKPRTWREIVTCFSAAGRGLVSAHRAGLVHRDFKPENVMVGRDGEVRVMDFGLARSIAAPSADGKDGSANAAIVAAARRSTSMAVPVPVPAPVSSPTASSTVGASDWSGGGPTRNLGTDSQLDRSDTRSPLLSPLTQTGAMMGTPAYMAPEQFKGEPVDARSDQFAFCVGLYEALYAQRPFQGRTLNDLTKSVLAGQVRDAPPQARVPTWLRRVLLRGLRVDRAERFPSMEALLAALSQDPAKVRRRWAAAISVAGLIATLGAALLQSSRQQRTRCLGSEAKLAGIWELPVVGAPASSRKEAIRRAFAATGKKYAANSFSVVTAALDRYVTAWNDMHRDACEATHVRGEQSAEVLDLRMSCLQDRFSEVRALTAVFSDANGDVVSKAAEAVQALRPVELCADVAALKAVVRPPEDPMVRRAVAEVRTRLADVKALADAGRYKKAMQEISPIIDAARKTNYGPAIAEALRRVADLQAQAGDFAKAEVSDEEAVWLAEASHDDEIVLEASDQLIASVGYSQNRPEEGKRWAKFAAAVLQKLGTGHDVLAAWRAHNLAAILMKEGRKDEALAEVLQGLSLKQRALGGQHIDIGISLDAVSFVLSALGRYQEAYDYNQRALAVLTRALGTEHPHVANCLANGAEVLNHLGRYADSETSALKAVTIIDREFGSTSPLLGDPLMSIGQSRIEQGNAAGAVEILERAVAIRGSADGEPADVGDARFALARALVAAGHVTERAASLARQARQDFEHGQGARSRVAEVDRWLDAMGKPTLSMR